jgi:hypothetical protein
MAADPAILKRIRACPFARGGRVLVRYRANGYSLFARRSGELLVRLRLTGEGDDSAPDENDTADQQRHADQARHIDRALSEAQPPEVIEGH